MEPEVTRVGGVGGGWLCAINVCTAYPIYYYVACRVECRMSNTSAIKHTHATKTKGNIEKRRDCSVLKLNRLLEMGPGSLVLIPCFWVSFPRVGGGGLGQEMKT